MKKLIEWFKDSHRYQHFLGGMLIGAGATDPYCAAYVGAGVAGALEFKDKLYGNKWDWVDFIITVCGTAVGFTGRLAFKHYVL